MKTTTACAGCYNDVYNHGFGGSHRCWSADSAKVIRRLEFPTSRPPPFFGPILRLPDCYHRTGYVYLDPKLKGKDRWPS